jgi:hypothetical protein
MGRMIKWPREVDYEIQVSDNVVKIGRIREDGRMVKD